jgi:LuxR family transcriptional regulator
MPRVLAGKLQSSITRIQSAADFGALMHALSDGLGAFGIDGFLLALDFSSAEQMLATPFKQLPGYVGRLRELNLLAGDPIIARILGGDTGFSFNTHTLAREAADPRWRALVLEAPPVSGTVLPLPSAAGLKSVAIVSVEAGLPLDALAIDCAGIIARVAQMRAQLPAVADGGGDRRLLAANLSSVQLEVLTWAAKGKSNADIAIITGQSTRSVSYHMSEILRKLDVSGRSQAIALLARTER